MRINSVILAAAWIVALSMECQAITPVGKAGDWANTIAAAGLDGTLYTVEAGGALYATAPADGTWKQIGKADFAGTKFLLAWQDQLVSIEKSGALCLINPTDGSRRQSGKAGDWADTIAAAVLDNTLYTVEAGGALYATAPADGTWKQVGKPDFANTAFLFPLQGQLASIEKDGALYLINPADGSWRRSGKECEWKGTLAGGVCNGKIYTVASDGTLYAADAATGTRQVVESAQYSGVTHMAAIGSQLFAVSDKGNLYSISSTMSKAEPAAKKTEAANQTGDSNPALAGALTFKFMGKWKGDLAGLEKDPEFQKHKAADPATVQKLADMMSGMTMKVTLDGITMTVMDKSSGPYPFEAISASGSTLGIETKGGPKKGVRSKIIFRDDKHIQVIEDNGNAMFFKKD
jgi:hypothetical protein